MKMLKEYKNLKKGCLVKCSDIMWDIYDEDEKTQKKLEKELPEDVNVLIDEEDIQNTISEKVGDILCDKYGFCIYGFSIDCVEMWENKNKDIMDIFKWFKYHSKNLTNQQIYKLEELCEKLNINVNYRN